MKKFETSYFKFICIENGDVELNKLNTSWEYLELIVKSHEMSTSKVNFTSVYFTSKSLLQKAHLKEKLYYVQYKI